MDSTLCVIYLRNILTWSAIYGFYWLCRTSQKQIYGFYCLRRTSHHHHIHFRALFSCTEGWAFWQVFLEGVLSTQNDFEGQQNPYLASFCHSQALHPMISLTCQVFSVQPHSACVLLQSQKHILLDLQSMNSTLCVVHLRNIFCLICNLWILLSVSYISETSLLDLQSMDSTLCVIYLSNIFTWSAIYGFYSLCHISQKHLYLICNL